MHARKPCPSAVDPALDHFADTLETVAAAPAPGNDPAAPRQPPFFRMLQASHGSDHLEVDWQGRTSLPLFGHRLAAVYRGLHAVDGLAALLQADCAARHESDVDERLSDYHREQLFLALTELTHRLNIDMALISEQLMDEDMQAERAAEGGRA